ncbi:alpha/beta-hydrolase [Coprinopsis marcescibilis]|uniref:Alpha/beta-hydrolase n=1 Tax=Coprinopsis marcescibilis TaxID=230819 RepID=A0A5C3L706_COPMA|nr:alpha/beta-hydrolase [Coprinopsis marcescibilis]
MPFISVSCPSGEHEFFYSISTPKSASTSAIEKGIPTILFIHSSYAAQEVFEHQFADPQLRRFNLVVVDNLGNGATRGFIGDQLYTPYESALDWKCVMDALDLPPVHIFGLSLGGTVGLHLAIGHPDRVLSVTVCSPATPVETEDVIAGRQQVFNYWMQVFGNMTDDDESKKQQQELIDDTLSGVMELAYNNTKTRLTYALGLCGMVRAIDIWSGSREKLQQSLDSTVLWFANRRAITPEALARIQCPVNIIHCMDDVGYPAENAEDIAKEMASVGVAVKLYRVPGPHYAVATHPEPINNILKNFVLRASGLKGDSLPTPEPEIDDDKMRTPWTELLARLGYDPENDADSDSSDDLPTFDSWFDIPPIVPESRTWSKTKSAQ